MGVSVSCVGTRFCRRPLLLSGGEKAPEIPEPIQYHADLRSGVSLIGALEHQKALPVGADIELSSVVSRTWPREQARRGAGGFFVRYPHGRVT